jgi:hypothetical protein
MPRGLGPRITPPEAIRGSHRHGPPFLGYPWEPEVELGGGGAPAELPCRRAGLPTVAIGIAGQFRYPIRVMLAGHTRPVR